MKMGVLQAAAVMANVALTSAASNASKASVDLPSSTVTILLSNAATVTAGPALDFTDFNPFQIDPVDLFSERYQHHDPWTKPKPKLVGQYVNWTSYNANGVNLGCWLELEYSCYEAWWASLGTTAADEWNLCEQLGTSKCAEVFDNHFATYINESTIDALADVGVNTLRIPTSYATWIRVPGSQLYHGDQRYYLRKIMNYAIEKYSMHVAIGLHSLPGGVNSLDIGEAVGHNAWFFSNKNLEYSMLAIEEIIHFIKKNSFRKWVTIEPINEAANNLSAFGTCDGLTTPAKAWVATYINLVLDRVARFDDQIPVMLQDCFCGESTWSPYFDPSSNLAIDTHVYYFADAGVYSQYVAPAVCGQAATLAGDGIFPVFVGEWALQTTYNNTYENRATIFNTQRYAWSKYVHGGAFWSAVHYGNATVSGQGVQESYWSYLRLIEEGVITSETGSSYC